LSDLTAIATSVARREPWRVLRASSITLLVAFCGGTSPPRLLSAFCGKTPSANSFAPARWCRGYTYSRRSRRVQPSFSSHPPASQIFRRRPHFPSCANAKRSISGPSAVERLEWIFRWYGRLCTDGDSVGWEFELMVRIHRAPPRSASLILRNNMPHQRPNSRLLSGPCGRCVFGSVLGDGLRAIFRLSAGKVSKAIFSGTGVSDCVVGRRRSRSSFPTRAWI
jgi:hypothetical protein